MEDQKTVYIFGPMTGYPEYNFAAFDDAKARLEALGYKVISPADMSRATLADHGIHAPYGGGDKPYNHTIPYHVCIEFMLNDLRAVAHCDMMVGIENWAESTGGKLELDMRWFCKKALGKNIVVKTLAEVEAGHAAAR